MSRAHAAITVKLLPTCALTAGLTLLSTPAWAIQPVLDIPYRTAEQDWEQNLNNLDVYSPDTGTDLPVVIYVHGGGWAGGDKSVVYMQPQFFTDNQIVYVSINHRVSFPMSPNPHLYPKHPDDVAEAIAWVSANIADYGGDPTKVFLAGHSSGAHLVALMSVDSGYLAANGLDLDAIRGTIFLDGGDFDFVARYPALSMTGLVNFNLVFGTTIPYGDWAGASAEDVAIWLDASPIEYVVPDAEFPDFLFIKAGTKTDTQPDDMLAEIVSNTDSAATLWVARGKDHGAVNSDLGVPGDPMNDVVLEFIETTLAGGGDGDGDSEDSGDSTGSEESESSDTDGESGGSDGETGVDGGSDSDGGESGSDLGTTTEDGSGCACNSRGEQGWSGLGVLVFAGLLRRRSPRRA